jgi:3-(3-hydroxy-phenyl)propionate hydroxylase
VADTDNWSSDLTAPGMPMPDVLLDDGTHPPQHLSQQLGKSFVCIVLGTALEPSKQVNLEQNGIKICSCSGNKNAVYSLFGLSNLNEPALILVRPDGYVMGRWKGADIAPLLAAMKQTGVTL